MNNTILVIDDEPFNRLTITCLLETYIKDCTIIDAATGEQGAQAAIAELPDVVLLDVILPDRDGYDICNQLKSDIRTAHIPIILITAIATDSESRARGLEIGADAFVAKPIDPNELAAQVKAMLRIKHAEDQLRAEKVQLQDMNVTLESMVEARTAELQLLQRINNAVNLGKTLDTVLNLTVKGIRDFFGFATSTIYMLNPDGTELEVKAISLADNSTGDFAEGFSKEFKGMRAQLVPGSWFYDVVQTQKPSVFNSMKETLTRYPKNTDFLEPAKKVVKALGLKGIAHAPLVASAEVIGILGVTRTTDITAHDMEVIERLTSQASLTIHKAQVEEELRREYAFRTAIENSELSGIAVVDTTGRHIYDNQAFTNMVGLDRNELYGTTPPFAYWPPQEAEISNSRFQLMLEGRLSGSSFEMQLCHRSGKQFMALMQSSPLRDGSGELLGWITSVYDITEHKELERRVLEISSEERQRLGHELHDGVGQLLTGTAFMAKGLHTRLEKDGIHNNAVSDIVENLNKSISMVRSLSQGLCPLELKQGSLQDAIRDLANNTARTYNVNCTLNMDCKVKFNNATTVNQLYLIVSEAINNAAKHSKSDNISVDVYLLDGRIAISVSDNGSARLKSPSSGAVGGIGLKIMRYRAALIGADFKFEDREGKGSRALCTCPIERL